MSLLLLLFAFAFSISIYAGYLCNVALDRFHVERFCSLSSTYHFHHSAIPESQRKQNHMRFFYVCCCCIRVVGLFINALDCETDFIKIDCFTFIQRRRTIMQHAWLIATM